MGPPCPAEMSSGTQPMRRRCSGPSWDPRRCSHHGFGQACTRCGSVDRVVLALIHHPLVPSPHLCRVCGGGGGEGTATFRSVLYSGSWILTFSCGLLARQRGSSQCCTGVHPHRQLHPHVVPQQGQNSWATRSGTRSEHTFHTFFSTKNLAPTSVLFQLFR